jgi:hypothetical protein
LAQAEALARHLEGRLGAAPCWLLVGEPALTAFDAALPVLITDDISPLSWAPALRRVRSSLSLELSRERPALARVLARLLVPTS